MAKKKEKDVIDQLLDQIDFHGMTAEELAGENGLLKNLTSRFTPGLWMPKWIPIWATRKMTMPVIIPGTAGTATLPRRSFLKTTTQLRFRFREIATVPLNL